MHKNEADIATRRGTFGQPRFMIMVYSLPKF